MQELKAPTEHPPADLSVHDGTNNSDLAKKSAVIGVLAALSVAIAPVASFLPRLNWGIALFDPVSFVWIIAFLLGGPYVGVMTSIVGTLGLGFWDPTFVGPFFKFVATIPMIIVPTVYVSLYKNCETNGQLLSKASIYFILMLVAFIVRIAIMVPVNIALVPILMGVDDLQFIIDYTILINVVQSIWDAFVPFVIVHRTRLYTHFKMW